MRTTTFEHVVMPPEDYEALKKDAARYRWLRGPQDGIVVGTLPGTIDYGMSVIVPTYEQWLSGTEMDAAIDDAMSKDWRSTGRP